MGLGSLERTSAIEARAEAAKLKALVDQKIDPIEKRKQEADQSAIDRAEQHKQAEKASHTFAAVAKEYIAANRAGWANLKHAQQWENTLTTYAFPVIGEIPVGEITNEQVLKILQKIWATKTETATRVRSRIELVMDYAKAHGWRTAENPAVWRGNLKAILPKPTRLKNIQHHPALPWQKMPAFMTALRQRKGVGARAIEFAILTAARSGEVRGATWQEIDLEQKIWTVPAARMKAKREHRVALSEDAVKLLQALPRIVDNDLLFPGSRDGRPLSDMTLSSVLRRMNEETSASWVDKAGDPVVPHGFRSTFRDWSAESTNYPSEMAEMALAHTIGNKVEAAYRRQDMLEKRRQMMADWAEWCHPSKGKKVISINTKAG
jgi:integrase